MANTQPDPVAELPFDADTSEEVLELFQFCRQYRRRLQDMLIDRPDITDEAPDVREWLCDYVETKVRIALDQLAQLQLERMRRNQDYGPTGQTIVLSSHRRLYKQAFAQAGRSVLGDTYGCLTVDQLKELEFSWTVTILGQTIALGRDDLINRDLYVVGSTKRLFCNRSGPFASGLFGEFVTKEEKVTICRREEARTPITSLLVTALAHPQRYVVREEACQYVTEKKWLTVLRRLLAQNDRIDGYDEIDRLRDAIDLVVARSYITDVGRDLGALQEQVYRDVIWQANLFCQGHQALFANVEADLLALSRALLHRPLGFPIHTALEECVLQMSGPIGRFAAMYEQNPGAAQRMLLMFVSDYWYPRNSVLAARSNLLLAVLIPYVADGAIDFAKLVQDLPSTFQTLQGHYTSFLRMVRERVLAAPVVYPSYSGQSAMDVADADLYFREDEAIDQQRPSRKEVEAERIRYWLTALTFMETQSPQAFQELFDAACVFEVTVHSQLLSSVDPTESWRYLDNLRGYLIHELGRRGFAAR